MNPTIRLLFFLLFCSLLWAPHRSAAQMDPDAAAFHFGRGPAVWGMRLSPDGQRVSFLRTHDSGIPVAMVIDLRTGKGNVLLASDPGKLDVVRCEWANNDRLLCLFWGVQRIKDTHIGTTKDVIYPIGRLVAVNADASNVQVLSDHRTSARLGKVRAEMIDLLPDEPDHILIPISNGRGEGVVRADIVRNKTQTVMRVRNSVWGYWADSAGDIRLRLDVEMTSVDLQFRRAGEKKWRPLHQFEFDEPYDIYEPMGFGADPDDLMVLAQHEGRVALFRENLGESRGRTLIYAHPKVDIDGLRTIGKYGRGIGVDYTTDRARTHYFDKKIQALEAHLAELLPGLAIRLIDESWDKRFYLLDASSDIHGGAYYRFDTKSSTLSKVTERFPWLKDEPLASMEFVEFPGEDGVLVPGYVTQLSETRGSPQPAIVLPHGGPFSRDEWGFDSLAQLFAAQGMVVLQVNYRGSAGYGAEWAGNGAFRGWRRAVSDIDHGLSYLVEQGRVDPGRVCAVGWSFGGYAALMSVIEHPERYRCVVSIAGVHDPIAIKRVPGGAHIARRSMETRFGSDDDVLKVGSPRRRAKDVEVPVFLAHANEDVNVPIEQSEIMAKALRNAGKTVLFHEIEGDDHQIRKPSNRIGMYQEVGDFLERHLRRLPPNDAVTAGERDE